MMMGSSQGAGEELKSNGIVQGHAYALVNVHVLDRDDILADHLMEFEGRLPLHICEMRNPWGKGEWTGAWKDGC
jgi:hypothetical protein